MRSTICAASRPAYRQHGRPPVPLIARRAAGLVQPAASQHAVSGAGPDRLHRDDHRRGLDGAVDRPREGARHDGAGADGAARRRSRSSSARRFPISSSRWRRRCASSWWRRWCCSGCRCAGRGCCCCSRCRCFWSARSGLGLLISSVADNAAGGVSAGAAGVVSADADAVRLHLSDCQHAGVSAGRSPTSCRRATS